MNETLWGTMGLKSFGLLLVYLTQEAVPVLSPELFYMTFSMLSHKMMIINYNNANNNDNGEWNRTLSSHVTTVVFV